jgi:hypothetical protein
MTRHERNRENVRNWREKKTAQGYVRFELYLHQDVIDRLPAHIDSPVTLGQWLAEHFNREAQ